MRCFGHHFDSAGVIGRLYKPGDPIDGIKCWVFVDSSETDLIVYQCSLCRDGYLHWLCSDKAWHSLPSVLHNKYLSKICFLTVRRFIRLNQES